MKERIRELVDVPEKVVIAIGAAGLVLSLFEPSLLNPSLILIAGGAISLGITRAVWPKQAKS